MTKEFAVPTGSTRELETGLVVSTLMFQAVEC